MPRLNTASEVLAECDEFGYVAAGPTDTEIGELGESGITLAVQTEKNEVRSGSQREVYTYIRGATTQMWRGTLLNVNLNNYAFALGQLESDITGAGTTASPYELTINPDNFGAEAARTYYTRGTRVDGHIVRADATARVFAPSVEWVMAQGQPTLIPFALDLSGTWTLQRWDPTT